MSAYIEKCPLEKDMKKFLRTHVEAEINSHWDELANTSFLLKVDILTKQIEINFKKEKHKISFQNEIDIETLKQIIREILLKDEFSVNFDEKETGINCFVHGLL